MLWTIDGEEIAIPSGSNKKHIVDLESDIKQLPVLNLNEIVTELINDIVCNVLNLSQKIKWIFTKL